MSPQHHLTGLVLLLSSGLAVGADAPRFEIYALKTAGGEFALAEEVSNTGLVVGASEVGPGDYSTLGAVWDVDMSLTDLPGVPPLNRSTWGEAISRNGRWIVGLSQHPDIETAWEQTPDGWVATPIVTGPGLGVMFANDINDNGVVVGVVGGSNGGGAIWSVADGLILPRLSTLDGDEVFRVGDFFDVSTDGRAVGVLTRVTDVARPDGSVETIYTNQAAIYDIPTSTWTYLEPKPTGNSRWPGLNATRPVKVLPNGDIVGRFNRNDGPDRPAIWRYDPMTETYSEAHEFAIDLSAPDGAPLPGLTLDSSMWDANRNGWIVGDIEHDLDGDFVNDLSGGFLLDSHSEVMYEMASLIADDEERAHWSNVTPLGVNDRGWIVGTGARDGIDGVAFLMKPIVNCPADLAPPAGTLDFADVLAFLTGFVEGDIASDMALPFGVLDFTDVVAFLTSLGAGCP